jgi:predicted aspartyl protease
MERDVGETVVRIGGNRATRMVVFGGENDPALLGADTLEGLLLSVDPVAKRLVPVEAYLLRSEA